MLKRNLLTKLTVFITIIALTFSLFTGCSSKEDDATDASNDTNAEQTAKKPKYIFYFIGDGLGPAQRQIAEYYLRHMENDDSEELLMNTFDHYGMTTTYSNDTLITDSAAAGTALATGKKTNNAMISQLPDGTNAETLVEAAEEKGFATGIISTTRLTHATPASFATHIDDRGKENEIAEQFVDSDVEFLAAGGLRNFAPQSGEFGKSKREDDRNLLAEFEEKGYVVYTSGTEIKDAENAIKDQDKVLALPTSSHLPYEVDRVNSDTDAPSLEELVDLGIKNLSKHTDGFLLVVEGGRIDHAAHAHDANSVIHDTLAFDRAIKKAYDFYLEYPDETLIVVGGDHETGGLGLGIQRNYFMNLDVLDTVKASIEDTVKKAYTGDRDAYFTFIGEELGLSDLTDDERTQIIAAMDLEDSIPEIDGAKEYDINKWGYNGPVEITTANILSERAALSWTTYAHSGTAISLSAQGVGAENFSQYIDNTDIPKIIADLAGFELN